MKLSFCQRSHFQIMQGKYYRQDCNFKKKKIRNQILNAPTFFQATKDFLIYIYIFYKQRCIHRYNFYLTCGMENMIEKSNQRPLFLNREGIYRFLFNMYSIGWSQITQICQNPIYYFINPMIGRFKMINKVSQIKVHTALETREIIAIKQELEQDGF